MNIGSIQAQPGSKAYGFFLSGETHGRFSVHIPLHLIVGANPGPVLVVQAGVSGLEIEPAMVLPEVVREIDAAALSGTVIIVPLMNTSGFEFEQVNSAWDNKDLNSLGRGSKTGTVSEQMIAAYYDAVLSKADAIIDVRTGAQWDYHHYAGVYEVGNANKSKLLATALGLPHVLVGQPHDQTMACAAASDGKIVVAAYTGGGPGLRDFREEDLGYVRSSVFNALRFMNMLSGAQENSGVKVVKAHTFLTGNGERGFTFMDSSKRGTMVKAGDQLGYIRHPFTGEIVERITAPRDGFMIDAGVSWPVALEGHVLAILGDLAE